MRIGKYYKPGQVLFIRDSFSKEIIIYIVISDSEYFIDCFRFLEGEFGFVKLNKMFHDTFQETIIEKYCK